MLVSFQTTQNKSVTKQCSNEVWRATATSPSCLQSSFRWLTISLTVNLCSLNRCGLCTIHTEPLGDQPRRNTVSDVARSRLIRSYDRLSDSREFSERGVCIINVYLPIKIKGFLRVAYHLYAKVSMRYDN